MLCLNIRGANILWSLFILLENVNFWFSSIEQIWGFCDNKPKKNNKTKPKPRLKLPWGCLWFMYGEWVFLFIYLFFFGFGFLRNGFGSSSLVASWSFFFFFTPSSSPCMLLQSIVTVLWKFEFHVDNFIHFGLELECLRLDFYSELESVRLEILIS